jgi:hypothetical protein
MQEDNLSNSVKTGYTTYIIKNPSIPDNVADALRAVQLAHIPAVAGG